MLALTLAAEKDSILGPGRSALAAEACGMVRPGRPATSAAAAGDQVSPPARSRPAEMKRE